jgi:hypothetical protein
MLRRRTPGAARVVLVGGEASCPTDRVITQLM